jgi:hypothetical protein
MNGIVVPMGKTLGSLIKNRSGQFNRPLRPCLELAKLDRGAGRFEKSLGGIGVGLGHLLLDHLGSCFDEILGLLEAKSRNGPDLFDRLDLLGRIDGLEEDGELGLLGKLG